jgi:hypothetical protein
MLYGGLALMQVDVSSCLFIAHTLIKEKVTDFPLGFLWCRGDKSDLDTIAGGKKTELFTTGNYRNLPEWGAGVIGKG